jgi:ABC-type multidrug transport system fused ATPase/permease subunit
VVLEDGLIREVGGHAELLRNNGLYRRLYNMQFKEEGGQSRGSS